MIFCYMFQVTSNLEEVAKFIEEKAPHKLHHTITVGSVRAGNV